MKTKAAASKSAVKAAVKSAPKPAVKVAAKKVAAKKEVAVKVAKKVAAKPEAAVKGKGKNTDRAKPETETTVAIAPGIICGFRGYTSTEGLTEADLVFEKGNRLVVLNPAKVDGKVQKGQWECQVEGQEIFGVVLEEELRVLKQPKVAEPLPEVDNSETVKELLSTSESTTAAETLIGEMEKNEFVLGGIIHEIRLRNAHERVVDKKGKQLYVGSEGFARYSEERLKMNPRKAYGLADIYVTARQVGLDENDVSKVGWTKMMEIVRVVTPKNKGKLVKFAGEHTVPELKEFITTLKASGDVSERGSSGKKRGGHSVTNFGFSVPGDRGDMIRQAIGIAKDGIREDGKDEPSDSEAFAALCSEYLAIRDATDMSFEVAAAAFTARFPNATISQE